MVVTKHLSVIAVLAALPVPALAHHGVSGQFDTGQTYEIAGTITRIRIVNPHSYVYFDVADDAGDVTNMRCEWGRGQRDPTRPLPARNAVRKVLHAKFVLA